MEEQTLTDDEFDAFVTEMVESSPLLKRARTVKMNRSRLEIPRVSLDGGMASVGTTVLVCSRLLLPWTVNNDFLRDSAGRADRLMRHLMAQQSGLDIEDLMLNGDECSGDGLLMANDGLHTKDTHTVSAKRAKSIAEVLDLAIVHLPTKYHRSDSLIAVVSPNVFTSYLQQMGTGYIKDVNFKIGPDAQVVHRGVEIVQSPFQRDDRILLTDANNIIFGIERRAKLRKAKGDREEDDQTYYTLQINADVEFGNEDAAVQVVNIPVEVAMNTPRIGRFRRIWLKLRNRA